MNNSPLEQLARQYGNVVQYDAKGNPSIFCKFPKMKSSDLDASLPDHIHPAFVINNVEEDAILIGKYMSSELEGNGTQYSLPNMPPRVSMHHDTFLQKMRAFGNGASGITIADHGFMLLLAHKNQWEPHGNNNWGCDYRDASPWELAKAYTVGTIRSFRGWTYNCIKAHTSSAELLPSESPLYWQKQKHVGGTPAAESQYNADSQYRGYNTLTGSGPIDWYLGSDPGNLCDIQGNAFEQVYGFRLVNCEIQILGDNNNAADATADCSANGAWKAILPNRADNGYTLVAPGTPGTLHYTWQNSKITIDTVEPTFDGEYRGTTFASMGVNTTNIPYMPSIMYELGLAPIPGTTVQGYFYVHMTQDERVARRGGPYYRTSFAGMAFLSCNSPRSYASANYGGRPRSRLNP